jgi:hypothetical protein
VWSILTSFRDLLVELGARLEPRYFIPLTKRAPECPLHARSAAICLPIRTHDSVQNAAQQSISQNPRRHPLRILTGLPERKRGRDLLKERPEVGRAGLR